MPSYVNDVQYVADMRFVANTVNELAQRIRQLEAVEVPVGGGVPAHTILDATVHTDTALHVVVAGDIIYADATPEWNALAHPASDNYYLASGAALPNWVQNITLNDDAWIGLGAGAGRLIFDTTPATDQVQINTADFSFVTAGTGIIHTASVAAGWIFLADGTRYIPANAATSVPIAPTGEGSIIVSDATPAWTETVHPGGAGYALITTGATVVWDQTPSWTGLHTFGAGWVLSGGTADLDGLDLIVDADGDSYLHASGDDVVQLVLATASGEFDININGANDFTFTANYFNVAVGSAILMADDTWIGLAMAKGRLVFDDTPAPDQVEIENADFNFITTSTGIIHTDGVAAGAFLRADGTRYIPSLFFINGTNGETYTLSSTGGTVPTGTGVATQVTYWTGVDTIAGDAGMTYDAANDSLSLLSSVSTRPIVEVQNTNTDAISASLDFYKNSASPADDDDLGIINFYGETSTSAKERYAYVLGESLDVTNATTHGAITFYVTMNTTERSLLRLQGWNGATPNEGRIIFNDDQQDVDFLVETVSHAYAFYINGLNGRVGIGATPGGRFEVFDIGNNFDTEGAKFCTSDWSTTANQGTAIVFYMGADTGDTYPIIQAYDQGSASTTDIAMQPSGGNIGIGTVTPTPVLGSTVLQVSNSAGSEVIITSSDTTVVTTDFIGGLVFSNADLSGTPPHEAGIQAVAADDFGRMSLHFSAGRTEYAASTYHMTISGASATLGYVGVNTTAPDYQLQVVASAPNTIAIEAAYGIASGEWVGYSWGNTTYTKAAFVFERDNTYARGDLHILMEYTADASTPTLADAIVTFQGSTGNVGIGTTGPRLRTDIVDTSANAYPATSGTDQTAGGILRLDGAGATVLDFGINATAGRVWLQGTSDADLALTREILLNPNGGNIGIGTTAPGNNHLYVYDNTLTSTASFTGISTYHIKTGGAGAAGDDYFGAYHYMYVNQSTTIDDLIGGYHFALMNNPTVDRIIGTYARTDIYAGTVNIYATGIYAYCNLDGGTVEDAYGIITFVVADTSVTSDIYGHWIYVDDNSGAGGTVYMLYLSEATGIDYGIYQDGTSDNYFGGYVGINTNDPGTYLNVSGSSATNLYPVYADNTNTATAATSNIALRLTGTDTVTSAGAIIRAGKEQSWTSTAGTRDGYFAILTRLNNASVEYVRVTSAGYVGIGITAPTAHLHVYDVTVTLTTTTYYGFRNEHAVTAGSPSSGVDFYGTYTDALFNNAGNTMDDLFGTYTAARISNGTAAQMYGAYAQSVLLGGTATDAYGLYARGYNNGGTTTNLYGAYIFAFNSVASTVNTDFIGCHIVADEDSASPAGLIAVLRLEGLTNITYGVYETGADYNYFESDAGFGEVTPTHQVDAYDDNANDYTVRVRNDGNNSNRYGIEVWCGNDSTGAGTYSYCYDCMRGDGTQEGGVRVNNGTVEVWNVSDIAWKTAVRPTRHGLADIMALQVRDFAWKDSFDIDNSWYTVGFVAQEAALVGIPGFVAPLDDGTLTTSPMRLIPILVKAVQEQTQTIERLQAEISNLRGQLDQIH